jgi:NAD(P)-dependent dehydrogenase (short-subunit alcohol dehydrogenase family)
LPGTCQRRRAWRHCDEPDREPGPDTEMELRLFAHGVRPDQQPGQPEQVAGVVAMLASDDGAWVNGEVIRVDGGTHG